MSRTSALMTSTVILFCMAAHARGGNLQATLNLLGGLPGQSISFTFNDTGYNVKASEVLGTRTGGIDLLVPANFEAFCVELNQDVLAAPNIVDFDNVVPLGGSTTNPLGDPDDTPIFFDANRTLYMQRLWGSFEPLVNNYLTAGAFQLALWELAWDTDQTLVGTLAGPEVMFSNVLDPLAALAENWLAQVRDLNVVLFTQPLLLITDPDLQDMVTPSPEPGFNTPEPSSLALGCLAAVGLLGMGRSRRKRN